MNALIENTKSAVDKLLKSMDGHKFFDMENEEERLSKLAIIIMRSGYVIHPSDSGIVAVLIDKIVMAGRNETKEDFAE